MKIQIVQIADRGVPYQERLHLRVVEPTNLGSHMVMSSVWVSPTGVANGSRSVFWFPPLDVKPNDDIVLYTRAGAQIEPQVSLSGARTHFYFWGQAHTLWSNPDDCALLFDMASWTPTASLNPQSQQYWQQIYSGLPPQQQMNALAGYGVAGQYLRGPGSPNVVANALTGNSPTADDDDDERPFGIT